MSILFLKSHKNHNFLFLALGFVMAVVLSSISSSAWAKVMKANSPTNKTHVRCHAGHDRGAITPKDLSYSKYVINKFEDHLGEIGVEKQKASWYGNKREGNKIVKGFVSGSIYPCSAYYDRMDKLKKIRTKRRAELKAKIAKRNNSLVKKMIAKDMSKQPCPTSNHNSQAELIAELRDYAGGGLRKVAIYGVRNDYVAVRDIDIAKDETIDPDLKNIISRVFRVKIGAKGDYYGSGFITGPKCDKIITAKHNTHFTHDEDLPGQRIREDVSVQYKKNGKAVKSNFLSIRDYLDEWTVADESVTYNLSKPIKSVSCKPVPTVYRKDLKVLRDKKKLDQLACRLIGFPEQKKFVSGKRMSAIPKPGGGWYPMGTRGMTQRNCRILHIDDSGKLYHTCDTLGGASGGPIVCKVNKKWSYVGTNNGGSCVVAGRNGAVEDVEACYNAEEGLQVTTEDDDNQVYGTAGSLVKPKEK